MKQCFPLHGAGTAAQLPDLFLSEETFRIITSTGDVIRALRDGSTQVGAWTERQNMDLVMTERFCSTGSVCRRFGQVQLRFCSSV